MGGADGKVVLSTIFWPDMAGFYLVFVCFIFMASDVKRFFLIFKGKLFYNYYRSVRTEVTDSYWFQTLQDDSSNSFVRFIKRSNSIIVKKVHLKHKFCLLLWYDIIFLGIGNAFLGQQGILLLAKRLFIRGDSSYF